MSTFVAFLIAAVLFFAAVLLAFKVGYLIGKGVARMENQR